MPLFKKSEAQMQKANVLLNRIIDTLDEMYPSPNQEDKAYVAYALSKITARMVCQWSDADIAAFIKQWLDIIADMRKGQDTGELQ